MRVAKAKQVPYWTPECEEAVKARNKARNKMNSTKYIDGLHLIPTKESTSSAYYPPSEKGLMEKLLQQPKLEHETRNSLENNQENVRDKVRDTYSKLENRRKRNLIQ